MSQISQCTVSQPGVSCRLQAARELLPDYTAVVASSVKDGPLAGEQSFLFTKVIWPEDQLVLGKAARRPSVIAEAESSVAAQSRAPQPVSPSLSHHEASSAKQSVPKAALAPIAKDKATASVNDVQGQAVFLPVHIAQSVSHQASFLLQLLSALPDGCHLPELIV